MADPTELADAPTSPEGEAALTKLRQATARKIEYEANFMEAEWRQRIASKDQARIYTFLAPVTTETAQMAMDTLSQWVREDAAEPILLQLNSPGGSVLDGLALFDHIRFLNNEANATIDTTVLGAAMSMASVLLQAGNTRYASPNSYIMLHEVSNAMIGSISSIDDEAAFTRSLNDRLVDILASRSKLSADEIKTRWERKNWYLNAEEAVELGFADGIA